ncbi:MAG TPA: hypothetical protein VH703_03375 [Solirubrobacterales bacterium]|jgi:hypothetical protein
MIAAAARRRAMVARVRAANFTQRVDRRLNRFLLAAWPRLEAAWRGLRRAGAARLRWLGRRLRPAAVFFLRRMAWLEKRLLRLAAWARRTARAASAVLTPQRAIGLAILAAAACLLAAQFVEYRAVEVGQPGYAGLPAARAPTVAAETAGQAHAYLLAPVALLAGLLALAALRNERRRGLGRIVFALGLLSLAVILLVDLPSGLDEGAATARFAGASAVLYDGFYAELAAALGLILGGALLLGAHRAPIGHRPRKPSLARNSRCALAPRLRRGSARRRARTSGA